MWCPKCRNEYIEGVKTCVDCGCDLVDELPVEMDETKPQIIGTVTNEEVGNIFVKFFQYTGIQTITLLPHEEDEGMDLAVAYPELEPALSIVSSFAEIEEDKDINMEDYIPYIQGKLDELESEKANEYLSDLRNEASTVYVNKKDKYSDFKFSGYSFILFGVLGEIFVALNLLKVIHIFNMFSVIVMAVVFLIFFGIGINSLSRAKQIKKLVGDEEDKESLVKEYMDEHFTDEYLASFQVDGETAEESFFQVTDQLKAQMMEVFPDMNSDFIGQLVDERYDAFCESQE